MMYGFAFAVNEISLVLFTTLAPSGALAFVLMAIPLFKGGIDGDARGRLSKLLCIPLVVTMVGLVASATHLGNPDNALYVIAGIGRSPLSTEVASAVAFLALAGVYWLLTFARRFPLALQRVWLVAAAIAALAFVGAVAFAYGRETIVTWNLWQVPAALCLNALVGGPILALAGFRAARTPLGDGGEKALLALAAAALVANVVVYVTQGVALAGMGNSFGRAIDLAPGFWPALAAFFVLCAAGIVAMIGARRFAVAQSYRLRLVISCAASVLVFAGVFLMRFVFYMTHMTVGL